MSKTTFSIGCECGDLFLAHSLEAAKDEFLAHTLCYVIQDRPAHKVAMSATAIDPVMSHPQLSVLRGVAHNMGLEFRAENAGKTMVERRKNFSPRELMAAW